MKKLFFAFIAFAAVVYVAPASAQYGRREVKPPVAETVELDPSTPLGKVREIAERLEKIEATTEEIGRALEAHKIPDYKTSIDEILEASGATRAAVAQLGEIASGVRYVADAIETIEANTAAIGAVAENVATTAQYLRFVPTTERIDEKFAALEASVANTFNELYSANETSAAANLTAFEKIVDEKIASEKKAFAETFASFQATSTDDAAALKKKLETASNIIILLGLAVVATLVLNVVKWLVDMNREKTAEWKAMVAAAQSASAKKTTAK